MSNRGLRIEHNREYIFAVLVADRDVSAVMCYDAAGDGEPQSVVPVVLTRFVCAEKAFEETVACFLRDRIAGVGNGQMEFFRLNVGADNDFSAIFVCR